MCGMRGKSNSPRRLLALQAVREDSKGLHITSRAQGIEQELDLLLGMCCHACIGACTLLLQHSSQVHSFYRKLRKNY